MWGRMQCWFALLQSSAFLPQQDTTVCSVPSFAWHFPWVWETDSLQLNPYHWQMGLAPGADSALSHFSSFTAHSPQPASVRNCAPSPFPLFLKSDRKFHFFPTQYRYQNLLSLKFFVPTVQMIQMYWRSLSCLGGECQRPGDTGSPLCIC